MTAPDALLEVLSIGRGDIKMTFGADKAEVAKARKTITAMLRDGYTIMVETERGLKPVKRFDPKHAVYIISDLPEPDAKPDANGGPMPAPDEWTHEQARWWIDKLSDHVGSWEGIPVPLGADTPLRLRPGHPMAEFAVDGLQAAEAQQAADAEFVAGNGQPIAQVIERYRHQIAGLATAIAEAEASDG